MHLGSGRNTLVPGPGPSLFPGRVGVGEDRAGAVVVVGARSAVLGTVGAEACHEPEDLGACGRVENGGCRPGLRHTSPVGRIVPQVGDASRVDEQGVQGMFGEVVEPKNPPASIDPGRVGEDACARAMKDGLRGPSGKGTRPAGTGHGGGTQTPAQAPPAGLGRISRHTAILLPSGPVRHGRGENPLCRVSAACQEQKAATERAVKIACTAAGASHLREAANRGDQGLATSASDAAVAIAQNHELKTHDTTTPRPPLGSARRSHGLTEPATSRRARLRRSVPRLGSAQHTGALLKAFTPPTVR